MPYWDGSCERSFRRLPRISPTAPRHAEHAEMLRRLSDLESFSCLKLPGTWYSDVSGAIQPSHNPNVLPFQLQDSALGFQDVWVPGSVLESGHCR